MRGQIDNGELDEMEGFKRVFLMFTDSYDQTRKQVRRDRIRREVWEKDKVEWEWFEDDKALKNLKDTRFAISLGEPYSDESDGGDEDQGDKADSEDEEGDEEDMDEDEEDEEMEDDEEEDDEGAEENES